MTRFNDITVADVRATLSYDPITGLFTWAVDRPWAKKAKGDLAGTINVHGYAVVSVCRKNMRAHRVAWLLMTGKWPKGEIDHRNGVRHDNRFDNLRDVTVEVNRQNLHGACSTSKTGLLGVSVQEGRRPAAHIWVNGRSKYLGRFDTEEEAHQAYLLAKRQLHPGCTL